jgi:hypothetical protein
MEAPVDGQRRDAEALAVRADRALEVAAGLESVADRVAARLDPPMAQLVPATWAGRAADLARGAATAAAEDLTRAVHELHGVAQDLRAEAVDLRQRAVELRRTERERTSAATEVRG